MRKITYYDAAEGGGVQSVDGYGSYVMANDFDDLESEFNAAQSELAALREELAGMKETVALFESEYSKQSVSLTAAEHDLEFFKSGKREQFDRAEAAEQRNATLTKLLGDLYETVDFVWPEVVDALAQPTESGASE